jgi:hypothetical protein
MIEYMLFCASLSLAGCASSTLINAWDNDSSDPQGLRVGMFSYLNQGAGFVIEARIADVMAERGDSIYSISYPCST